MGWLDEEHRRHVLTKYKVRAYYRCDVCHNPIPIGGLIVIDPQKGYHRWPKGTPEGFKRLSAREPRWTSCYGCDKERRDTIRHKKQHKHRMFLRAQNRVMEMIEHKPKPEYWTKEKICRKLDNKFERGLILRAIRVLRKENRLKKRDGTYLPKK